MNQSKNLNFFCTGVKSPERMKTFEVEAEDFQGLLCRWPNQRGNQKDEEVSLAMLGIVWMPKTSLVRLVRYHMCHFHSLSHRNPKQMCCTDNYTYDTFYHVLPFYPHGPLVSESDTHTSGQMLG